ncbi:MAG: DUF4397 domain-containing protein [Rhodoferax sp.]|jgi:hypothetical protein|nr:DUF4397 domain-containing protein [Rhodoferax sp.]
MKFTHTFLLALVPVVGLSACGGSDTSDRLDLADPVVRFVHVAPLTPNLTLSHGTVVQPDVIDKPYKFASNYFNVDIGQNTWSIKTTVGNVTLGSEPIDASRGNKYTLVALPSLNTDGGLYLIVDPYNKPLTSDSARLRIMNASFNAGNIDLYMSALGTDITAATARPLIAATAYKTAGPASGGDSVDIPGGTYKVTITTAGTKVILFTGQLAFGNNADLLLLSVPDSLLPGAIKTLVKFEGSSGVSEISAL